MIGSVTHIIHNAWTVNFNLPLDAFEDQIAGVRTLVDVCAASDRRIRLIFTSSISVAAAWDPELGAVPERALPHAKYASASGYAASKYVAEKVSAITPVPFAVLPDSSAKILQEAVACGVSTPCARMGQACGSSATGAWGTSEWFPIMVKSSIAIGCLPDMKGVGNRIASLSVNY